MKEGIQKEGVKGGLPALILFQSRTHNRYHPGGWTVLGPEDLIMPVDTHIHAIAARLGLTGRKQADLRSALEITDAFRRICPSDPTRYSLDRKSVV